MAESLIYKSYLTYDHYTKSLNFQNNAGETMNIYLPFSKEPDNFDTIAEVINAKSEYEIYLGDNIINYMEAFEQHFLNNYLIELYIHKDVLIDHTQSFSQSIIFRDTEITFSQFTSGPYNDTPNIIRYCIKNLKGTHPAVVKSFDILDNTLTPEERADLIFKEIEKNNE